MNRQAGGSRDPDILASEKALRRAARRARKLGAQTGMPVYIVLNDRIIDLTRKRRLRVRAK
ncbi:MAG: hypothetical protein QME66_08155 [Candidatus Eisenbacteria bacterium]|nr:hypothetical protein [Candidatus Eisenbacteria bacterium]